MRATVGFVVAGLIGLPQPAWAECFGKYPATVCISDSGDVWIAGRSYPGASGSGSGIAKFPNAAPPPAQSTQTTSPGVTAVLQPSNQSGNAWVMAPQSSNGGAVVQGGGAGGTVTTCGAGSGCQ